MQICNHEKATPNAEMSDFSHPFIQFSQQSENLEKSETPEHSDNSDNPENQNERDGYSPTVSPDVPT